MDTNDHSLASFPQAELICGLGAVPARVPIDKCGPMTSLGLPMAGNGGLQLSSLKARGMIAGFGNECECVVLHVKITLEDELASVGCLRVRAGRLIASR